MVMNTALIGAIYLLLITSMFALGLEHTFHDIIAPFRDLRLVAAALLVNLILIPVAGYLLAGIFALSGAVFIGCILMTSAPGSSYAPVLADIADGDLPFATGLVFFLSTVALVSTPVTLLFVLPGASGADIWPVVRTLILVMLIPLLAGLFLRTRSPPISDRIKGPVYRISYAMILLVVGIGLWAELATPGAGEELISLFGSYSLLTMVLVVGLSMLFGYFLGGNSEGTRRSLAMGSSIRNAGMALLFATGSFGSMVSDILTVLITYIIIQTTMTAVAGLLLRRKSRGYWGRSP